MSSEKICVGRRQFSARLAWLILLLFIASFKLWQVEHDSEEVKEEEDVERQRDAKPFIEAMSELAALALPRPLLITFTNGAQADFVKSFLCNLRQLGGRDFESRLVTVVTDRSTLKSLSSFSESATLVLRPYQGGEGHLNFGTGRYMDFIEFRTQAILELLQANISLLLVDADHFWARDPLPWLDQQSGQDIITENAHFSPWESVCGGFLFLNHTLSTLQLWNKVTQQTKFFRSFPETNTINEQDVLTRILPEIVRQRRVFGAGKREHLWATAERLYPSPPRIAWIFFPSDKFAPGRWYFPEHAKDREKPVWSVHNTWVVGNEVKIARAKQFGHWFLNETSDSCMKPPPPLLNPQQHI